MSQIESNVVSALSNGISDDVQIKILVKDNNEDSSNKFKEIFSYKIDKSNFINN